MLTFIKMYWVHGILWAAMFTYVAISPQIYLRYILKEGKPVPGNKALPQPTDQIYFSVDRLDLIKAPGLFNLWGWSFFLGDKDQAAYSQWIVLQSPENTYFYPAETFPRPEVQTVYKDFNLDLSNAGFSTHISKYAIEPGEYRIGILFEHTASGAVYYIVTNKIILRTANHIHLEILNE